MPAPGRAPRIAIDARLYAGNYTGIGVYTRSLVDHLARIDSSSEYLLCSDRPLTPPAANFSTLVIENRRRIIWSQLLLPLSARCRGLDLFHATANHEAPLLLRCPLVVTVHDLIPLLFPAAVSARHRLNFRAFIGPAVHRARRIIAVSEAVRHNILHRFRLRPDKVTAIAEAADPAFFIPASPAARRLVREKHGIEGPYLLYVGSMEPRKNVPLLARAFARVTAGTPWSDWKLVIGGSGGWAREQTEREAREAGLGARLIITGFLPPEELPPLYQEASLFAFPSAYEGFGLPALEAMASGCPVLVPSAGALEELVGDAGLLFELGRPGDLEARLEQLLRQEKMARELGSRARKRAATFSWERTARETLAVYRRALDGG